MPSLSDVRASTKIKALVFSRFKLGKTAGAGTFPRPNFMMFDPDGIVTLTNPQLESKYQFSKNSVQFQSFIDPTNPSGIVVTHTAFDAACKYFDEMMKPGKVDTFDTWVIDSGTTLSEVAMNKAVILLGGNAFGKPLSQTHAQALKTGLLVPKMQDFGAERSLVEQFVDMVRDTDKHVLLLCHEKEKYSDAGNVEEIGPLFTGQSAERIPLKFSEVWNLRMKKEGTNDVRYLQTVADPQRRCGSRLGLPNGTPFEYQAIKKALNL